MTNNTTAVLVLDANQRSALAVTRSLGRQGLTIFTSDCTYDALAAHSHYSHKYLPSPSPAEEPQAFVDWLAETVQQYGIRFLQPVTEISSQLILRHRQRLPNACVLPFAPLHTVMALADKGKLVELAAEAGVARPETRFFAQGAELDPGTVHSYPVVLKPRLSRVFLGDRWLHTAVAIVHSREELARLLVDRVEFREHPFLLQSFVPGNGAGVFALYDRGRAVTFFAHRRLREKPPQGGVSVLSASAVPAPAALAAAQRLLDHVGWHGVAMVEFRVTPEGKPFLMEVNTRFWGSLQLAIDAGVDFPWLLHQLHDNQLATEGRSTSTEPAKAGQMPLSATAGTTRPIPAEVNASYRVGRRLRWWLGDVDSLYLFLRDPRYSLAAKLARVVAFLTPHPFTTRHEVFRWSDPRPAWFEFKTWLRALRD